MGGRTIYRTLPPKRTPFQTRTDRRHHFFVNGAWEKILCNCEAIAYLRFRYLGQFFMEPSDYYDAPINKVLHFIQSVGLIKGQSKGEAQ
jgi:hypothetical protein